jgi:hypothetical protein
MSFALLFRHVMTNQSRASAGWRPRLAAVLIAALVATVAAWARYDLVEPHAVAQACLARQGGVACAVRAAVVQVFNSGLLSTLALAATALALLWRHVASAALCLALGTAGLVLYSFQAGALALLVGALLLLPVARQA